MITIYHNPRCSKSREGVAFLEDRNIEYQTIKYLETPFTYETLSDMIQKLGIAPVELVRTKETIWKEQYKDKKLSDKEVIEAMVQHPTLIERPIIVNGSKAVIGRPIKRVLEII